MILLKKKKKLIREVRTVTSKVFHQLVWQEGVAMYYNVDTFSS